VDVCARTADFMCTILHNNYIYCYVHCQYYITSYANCSMSGTFYMLPEAYDVDASPYTVVGYRLTGEEAEVTSHDDVTPADGDQLPFRLEARRRDDSTYELRLIVTRPLDREVPLTVQLSCFVLCDTVSGVCVCAVHVAHPNPDSWKTVFAVSFRILYL